MSEAKTKCTTCSSTILQRTADRNNGLCAPCHAKAAAIPPSEFEIPSDIAERLAALNEDPAWFREMVWRDGVDFVHGFIDKREERNELYRKWSPRLRAFADECRKMSWMLGRVTRQQRGEPAFLEQNPCVPRSTSVRIRAHLCGIGNDHAQRRP